MRCAQCGVDNPNSTNFCVACGASLTANPPPLPGTAAEWFAAIGGKLAGPFAMADLAAKAAAGEFTREVLVWKQGMGGWTKAGEVAELSGAFGSVPPPLPPS